MKTTGGSEKDKDLWQARVWERIQKLCLYVVLSCITVEVYIESYRYTILNRMKIHNGIQWGTGSYKTSGVFVCFIGSPQIRLSFFPCLHLHTFFQNHHVHHVPVNLQVLRLNRNIMNPSWWFQPIWKILVKMGIFPK